MPRKGRDAKALSQVFRVLGNQTRLRLLMALHENEQNVTQLCRRLRTPQSTVSRHLGILRMVGLVTTRRDGKEVYYSIDGNHVTGAVAGARRLLDGSAVLRIGPIVLGIHKQ